MAPQYSTQVTLATTTVIAVTALAYYLRRRARNRIPQQWEPVGNVTEMFMYPLKSGRRVPIDNAICTEFGFQPTDPSLPHFRDRCLAIYQDPTKEIKSARDQPKILLLEAGVIDRDHFCLSASDMGSIIFKVPDQKVRVILIMYTEVVPTLDCGDEVAEWISNYVLGKPTGLRLGFHDGTHGREIKKYYPKQTARNPLLDNSAAGLYSDLATFHLFTKSSLEDLKAKIPNANITMNNFRPNIVVGGDIVPYSEDDWDWIKIGDVIIRKTMTVPRCRVTTLNPESAEPLKNYEPITSMKKFRPFQAYENEPPSPTFGIYTRLCSPGLIKLGDTVYLGKL
ncbi:mitochondrial amidoxime reducing component 2-like [Photinus pyralis]|nr:mitochondrial amidoxime reducing component 2-like [Photinus pyralis]XP_031335297.1 mitochondrial amidoxime reducing component 2-like [Photinus pyralis]